MTYGTDAAIKREPITEIELEGMAREFIRTALGGPDSEIASIRERNLRVMDSTAIAHCMEHDMPILVFNFRKEGTILRAVRGEKVGTRISSKPAS